MAFALVDSNERTTMGEHMTCHDRRHCQWNSLDQLADLQPGDGLPIDVHRTVETVLDHLEHLGLLEAVLAERQASSAARRKALGGLSA